MRVEVRNNDVNGALRVLKKKLQADNIFNELRRKEFHETRGEKRRRNRNAAKRRQQRELAKRKAELGY